ncbi:MAG: toprim domain-containing protein, partial [Pseudomonadota bacterium]
AVAGGAAGDRRPSQAGTRDRVRFSGTLGPIRGGAVHLVESQGALLVAEGIETSISAAALFAPSGASIWATLTASGMAGLMLPAVPGDLIIAPDHDAAGRAAAEALDKRASAFGWRVSHRAPPAGSGARTDGMP